MLKPLSFCAELLCCFSVCTQVLAADVTRQSIADAAEAKQWQRVQQLLREDKVDSDDGKHKAQPDGTTALHWAVHHGHLETVKALIKGKHDVDVQTRYEITPLLIACSLDNSEIVRLLAEAGADVHQEQPGGITPLMLAARTGNADSIRCLLKHGAKVDEGERKSQTALMWAAAEGNVAAVQALIDGGADINKSNHMGFTAMMFAVREGHKNVAACLLEAGVDINAVMRPRGSGNRAPRKGTSALLMAVESGHFELAMFLVANGADPNDQRCGIAPLHMVTGVRKPNRGEGTDGDPAPRGSGNLTSIQFVKQLIDAGADVNLKLTNGKSGRAVLNRKGATPMLLAGKTADIELMKVLVAAGADPLVGNADGCTPLMACAGIGVRAVGEEAGTEPEVIEALEYLISLGADVNTVDENKETAMHGAAYRCFPKVIELLAAHGAAPAIWDHKNKYGWTPVKIGEGYRPGSFKPSPPTIKALENAKVNFKKLIFTGKPKKLLDKGAGEGPAFHPEYGVFFSGPEGITLLNNAGDEPSGEASLFLPNSGSNGLLVDRGGDLLICQQKKHRVSRMKLKTGKLQVLTDSFEGNPYNTPNDITVNSKGQVYFSDPRYGSRDGMKIKDASGKTVEGVYRIDVDGSVSRVITHEVDRPNGVLVTPDDKYLFVADNHNNTQNAARVLWRFSLDEGGDIDLASQTKIMDWKTGRGPDGMAIDKDGRLYVAGGRNQPKLPFETADEFKGGVYVLSPEGKLVDFLPIERDEVTNCSFGGEDRRTLYITAGGTLWSVRTVTEGI